MFHDFKEFLSEADEVHALVIGLSEIIAFAPPRVHTPSVDRLNLIYTEYHYYMLGRALGILAWIPISWVIKVMFF